MGGKMKVLIANPPAYIGDHSRHFIQAGSRWSYSMQIKKKSDFKDHYLPYPFFIGYASALLKRDVDADIKAVDACALDFDDKEFVEYVKRYDPDLLVVEIPTISFPLMMNVLREIKKTTECKIACAGAHITALTNETMKKYKFIDYALLGEYEISLKELVNVLTTNATPKNLEQIQGIAFRDNGKVKVNPRRNLLKDLDILPFPDRDDLNVNHYHDFEIAGRPCVQLLSSRGCPFNCSFCLERQVLYASPIYRKRNPVKVVDEMEYVAEKYNAKQIYFDDQTMTVSKEHVTAICMEILSRNLDLPWACMGDITLDFKTLELMKKAGCVGIKFGIETICPETLKRAGKGFVNLQKAKLFREWCKKLGIWTHATYTIGLPGDTEEKVKATLKFALELDTDSAQFSIATPFPGTPFFETAKKEGWLLTLDWTKYDGNVSSVLTYPSLSKEKIEELFHSLGKSWQIHIIKRYLLNPFRLMKRAKLLGLKNLFKGLRYSYLG